MERLFLRQASSAFPSPLEIATLEHRFWTAAALVSLCLLDDLAIGMRFASDLTLL